MMGLTSFLINYDLKRMRSFNKILNSNFMDLQLGYYFGLREFSNNFSIAQPFIGSHLTDLIDFFLL